MPATKGTALVAAKSKAKAKAKAEPTADRAVTPAPGKTKLQAAKTAATKANALVAKIEEQRKAVQ